MNSQRYEPMQDQDSYLSHKNLNFDNYRDANVEDNMFRDDDQLIPDPVHLRSNLQESDNSQNVVDYNFDIFDKSDKQTGSVNKTRQVKSLMSFVTETKDKAPLESILQTDNTPVIREEELKTSSLLLSLAVDDVSLVFPFVTISNDVKSEKSKEVPAAALRKIQNDYEHKISNLNSEINALKEELAICQRNEEENASQLEKKYESQIIKLRKDLQEANDKCVKLEDSKKSILDKASTVDDMKTDLEAVSRERDELERKMDKYRVDLDNCRNDLNKSKMEYSRLKADFETMEQRRRDDMNKNEIDLDKKRHSLEQRLNESELDCQRLSEQNRSLQKELSDKNVTLNKAKDDLNNMSVLERKMSQLESDNNSLKRRVMDYEDMEGEYQQLRRRSSLVEADLADLSSENSQLRLQIQSLKLSLQKARQAHTDLELSMNTRRDYSKYDMEDNFEPPQRLYGGSGFESRMAGNRSYEYDSGSDIALSESVSKQSLSARAAEYVRAERSRPSEMSTPSSLKSNVTASSSVKSLAALVGGTSTGQRVEVPRSNPINRSTGVPFATEKTSEEMMYYDGLDRQLTTLTAEKTNLLEESERLHQRGGKTLRERNRLSQIESRLEVIGKDIGALRKTLATKPG